MKHSPYFRPLLTGLLVLVLIIVALPEQWKGWTPGFVQNAKLHFGLDLIGGTQLDFRISEEEMEDQLRKIDEEIATMERRGASPDDIAARRLEKSNIEEQRANMVEAIRTVLERRINALGVSEAVITPSYFGNEKHLLVECPGVVDTQECIAIVGKTIQLEFKEEFVEATEEFTASVRKKTDAAMKSITQSGRTLEAVGQDLGDDLGLAYMPRQQYFRDDLPKGLESVWTAPMNQVLRKDATVQVPVQDDQGNITMKEVPGIFLVQALGPRYQTGRVINEAPKAFTHLEKTEADLTYATHNKVALDAKVDSTIAATLRGMQPGELKTLSLLDGSARVLFLRLFEPGGEQVEASHILVAYQGASGAPADLTRSKEQALARAQALKVQLNNGADFHALAARESDGPSKAEGGRLGAFGRGTMVPSFDAAAFTLPQGAVSDPVETAFGYHLIRVDKAKVIAPDRASYDELMVKGVGAADRAQTILARLQSGNVRSTEEAVALRTLFFSLQPTGWKDTQLDGKHFRTASVTLDPVTNIPVVQIMFDDEGGKLFQELTKKNIQKRIAIFVGGELVSAPVVQQEISGGTAVITGSQNFDEAKRLAQDLNTGAIPAPIHLVGQYTVEATLGASALQTSLLAALLGTILLMLYMVIVYRLLGLLANFALVVYAFLFFVLLKLPLFLFSSNYIVLTLAGMAGIILSMGMAVDANVLVFERMKEELRKGKLLKTAVETSFIHAWPAIRDGNVSTLITCVILFMVGTSIVRGFAITLGLGVVLSMFTAITVTRWMLRKVATKEQFASRPELFGVKKRRA
ncbi:protein-export membrane protein SecD [Candidatus Peribacteria bacterium RIFCSPHIGHO2_02_FULL_52_16]|nr:MAG: protein-export membrane protein SecD [Candidatus Peribacteria bacterium RIFCSPHIGHO2_01_FULL_51_35]OGJ61744.1 MAG: protein-export membrane protein SecD [Candidatus Peribacteria bacterium RIFCSPHIGHO2_02_FULL_52_16]